MERLNVRKNVYLGFCVLYPILAIIACITEKDQPREVKKFFVTGCVFAAFSAALECIPFVGWVASIVLLVFWIITIVQTFKGNYEHRVPILGGIIDHFNNKW